MATTETLEKYLYDWSSESDGIQQGRLGIIALLDSIGLTIVEENTISNGLVLNTKFSNAPNFGIAFDITSSQINFSGIYWTTDGIVKSMASSSYFGTIYQSSTAYHYGGLGHRRRTVGKLTLDYLNGIASDGSWRGTAMTFSVMDFVDYFTLKTRKGLCIAYDNVIHAYMSNDDDTNFVTLSEVKVGGTTYPARNQTVATPLVWASSNFYGYMESSSSVYAIYMGSSKASVGTDVQVAVGGRTFEQIYPNYFVRVG